MWNGCNSAILAADVMINCITYANRGYDKAALHLSLDHNWRGSDSKSVWPAGETAAGNFPVEAVRVMTKICREAESSLDYYALFKSILKESPSPMSPLESLASSAVRTAHKVCSACQRSAHLPLPCTSHMLVTASEQCIA